LKGLLQAEQTVFTLEKDFLESQKQQKTRKIPKEREFSARSRIIFLKALF
jgi:hypothetical protein